MQKRECLSQKLREFVDGLIQLSNQNFPVDNVTEYLKTHIIPFMELEPYVYLNQSGYTRNLIYKSPEFELLLLCWGPEQVSAIHGHEGEKCWMRVEEGVLCFDTYDENGQGELVKVSSHEGSKGFVDGPAIIHGVGNPEKIRAASLHLYARPFSQCDIYHLEGMSKEKKQLKYDTIYGKIV